MLYKILRSIALAFAVSVLAWGVAGPAAAHPMGNFSINHYARIAPDDVQVCSRAGLRALVIHDDDLEVRVARRAQEARQAGTQQIQTILRRQRPVHSNTEIVCVARYGCQQVVILHGAGRVRQREEAEQRCRRVIDSTRWNTVSFERLARLRVDDTHTFAGAWVRRTER